jgi:DnaA family protein
MQRQLPLPIAEAAAPGFDNFARGSNGLVVDMLAGLANDNKVQQLFLCGPGQSGKSHLLSALHAQYLGASKRSFYVSLNRSHQGGALTPALLESLDNYELIVIDDVDHVAGLADWETSLFNLINFVRERHGKMVFSAAAAPSLETFELADLVSRLAWGPVLKLVPLNESEIRDAMFSAAQQRGMKLDSEAADFLLKRYKRDASSLLSAISILDNESLAAGRERITIPFLKQCFVFD